MTVGSVIDSALAVLTNNPALELALVGVSTKLVGDELEKLAAKWDASKGATIWKTPIKWTVAAASAVVTVGNLALQGNLSSINFVHLEDIVNQMVVAGLAGVSAHHCMKAAFQHYLGRETLKAPKVAPKSKKKKK